MTELPARLQVIKLEHQKRLAAAATNSRSWPRSRAPAARTVGAALLSACSVGRSENAPGGAANIRRGSGDCLLLALGSDGGVTHSARAPRVLPVNFSRCGVGGDGKQYIRIVARDLNEINVTNLSTYFGCSTRFGDLESRLSVAFNEHPNWAEVWLPGGQ